MHKKEDGFDLRCQLIEAEGGVSTYAKKWSETIDNSPTIVGNLADDILKTLKVSSKQDITKVPTPNPEAYEYYLKAKYRYDKRENEEDIEISKGLLQKAIQIDNKLYQGWDLLSNVFKNSGEINGADSILTEAIEISKGTNDKYQYNKLMLERGFIRIGNPKYSKDFLIYLDSLMVELDNALKVAQKENDIIYQAENLSKLGFWLIGYEKYNKAIKSLESSKKLYEKLNDNKNLSNVLTSLATSYVWSSYDNLEKGIQIYKSAINLQKRGNYLSGLARTYQHLGGAYIFAEQLDSASYYSEKSLFIWLQLKENKKLEGQYHNLGNLYSNLEDSKKSLSYFFQSEKLSGNEGYSFGRARLYLKEKKFDACLKIWNYRLNEAIKLNTELGQASILGEIGHVYFVQDSIEKSKEYFNKAFTIINKNYSTHESIQTDYYLSLAWYIMSNLPNLNNGINFEDIMIYIGKDIEKFLDEGYPFFSNRIKLLLIIGIINKELGNQNIMNEIYELCHPRISKNTMLRTNPIIQKLISGIAP